MPRCTRWSNAHRRIELVAMLAEEGRFDFDAVERAWGGR